MDPVIILAMFWCYYRSRARVVEDGGPVLRSEDSLVLMRSLMAEGIRDREVLKSMGVRESTLKAHYTNESKKYRIREFNKYAVEPKMLIWHKRQNELPMSS